MRMLNFFSMLIATLFFMQAGTCADRSQKSVRTIFEYRPALREFKEDVAAARRELRKSCVLVQKLMENKEPSTGKKEQALAFLMSSMEKWQRLHKKYKDNPPQEYTADTKFKIRLSDVTEALEDMAYYLEKGLYKRSFQSCGFACGLFVTMHEENNLAYALDGSFTYGRF